MCSDQSAAFWVFFVGVFVIFLDVILNRGYRISHSFLLPHSFSRQNNFQNSLFPDPSTTSRSINNSLRVYHFLDSEPELGKLKEFNSQKVKVPVNRAFKSYSFLPSKKSIKKQRSSAWNFLQHPTSLPPVKKKMCIGVSISNLNTVALVFSCLLFFKE